MVLSDWTDGMLNRLIRCYLEGVLRTMVRWSIIRSGKFVADFSNVSLLILSQENEMSHIKVAMGDRFGVFIQTLNNA